MSAFLQQLADTVNQRRLLGRGQKILVAVSGGVDSMVLLHALHHLAPQHGWTLAVAHFNHHLRGRSSDADERLVRQAAARLKLTFYSGGADVKALAAQSKISVEMAARNSRHAFLAQTARTEKIPTVALAHHADDQVELFFLRLLRGAGGDGLAGMKWRSPSPADPGVTLVRPLLDCSKADLRAAARDGKIRFRDDATNFSGDVLRNRIRNELLPLLLSQYQPGLSQTVLRLMEIVGAEAEFVSAAASEFRKSGKPKLKSGKRKAESGNSSEIKAGGGNGSGFEDWARAVQRRVLQEQLIELGVRPEFELVEQLRLRPEQPLDIAPGVSLVRDAAGNVARRVRTIPEFNPAEAAVVLSGRMGKAAFAGRIFSWTLKPFDAARGRFSGQPGRECFDANKVGREIILRHWRAGDRFQPLGLASATKLQDLFVNAKIPAARRRELVVAATASGEIFWVETLRPSERFKLSPATTRQLVWQWTPRILQNAQKAEAGTAALFPSGRLQEKRSSDAAGERWA